MKRQIALAVATTLFCALLPAHNTKVISYGNNIVRVLKGDGHESFSVIMKACKADSPSFRWEVDADGNVTFLDRKGNVLLRETGCAVTPITAGANKGLSEVSQTWRLDSNEPIYGLGQFHQSHINQRGRRVRMWNFNTRIYIPYFTSVKGYGLYWDNSGETWFADNRDGTTFRSAVASGIDYYFIYKDGTQDGVMEGVRQLSGQATMFPLWTMGFWQCRERYKTPEELKGVLDEYRRRRIPLDGIVQDWQYWGCDSNWNSMKFDGPAYEGKGSEMIDYVHKNNAHLMISVWANFGPWTDIHKEMRAKGHLYPFLTFPQNCGAAIYDPFSPEARDIYWKHLTTLYNANPDAWWTDCTEPDHYERDGDMDYMTHAGTWRAVKNAFPLMTNRGIYEHQRGIVKSKAKVSIPRDSKRCFQMTRSGAFGIQRYGTLSWSGDIRSTWEEMRAQISSGLNYVICGIPFWNTDLGGFTRRAYRSNPKDPFGKELNTRWIQWGTFMPLMRNHCCSPMVCEIYQFGDQGDWAYDSMKEAIELRYRLLPYIYSTAGATVQNSETMMRPFVMDFPRDSIALVCSDEYMFGRSLLVKPVTEPLYTWVDDKGVSHEIGKDIKSLALPVTVYLPATAGTARAVRRGEPADTTRYTRWYNFWTGELLDGGRAYKVAAPINRMPVFVREGAILPWGPDVQYSTEKPWDDLEIRVYPGADGDFILYEDEGDNYNYEKGAFTQIAMHWDDAARTLTIAGRKGSFKGMLKERKFRVRVIGGGTATVNYDGNRVETRI